MTDQSSASSSRCLVRGSINIDEFFHLPHIVRPGETISSTGLTRGAGGKGSNQANAVAQAGGKVEMDGCVGEDGIWVKDGLERAGVEVGRVKVIKEEVTGRAIIQIAEDGENSIVLHKGANYHIPTTDSSPPLDGISHMLLQNEIPLSSTLSYLRSASSAGIVSIFNPSPMLSPAELREFPWKCLSWLIVNQGELEDLLSALDISIKSDDLSIPKSGLLALRRQKDFNEMGLICTLGPKGIIYLSKDSSEPVSMGAAKPKIVKDTTGAGDCFAGYFAAGLMRGDEVDVALKTCLMACAMCVEKPGARDSVPNRKEVLERMKL